MELIDVRVVELKGKPLDWVVATLEGWTTCDMPLAQMWMRSSHRDARNHPIDKSLYELGFSSDWSLAGPLIEREKIQLTPLNQDNPRHGWAAAYIDRGEYGDDLFSRHRQRGISPLLAAMRCYVASKLGDVVRVPKELIN